MNAMQSEWNTEGMWSIKNVKEERMEMHLDKEWKMEFVCIAGKSRPMDISFVNHAWTNAGRYREK